MNDQNKDLPPLPESSAWRYRPKDGLTWPAYTEREAQALAYDAQPEPLYTADQMRDYALAALARHCAAPVVRQNGSPVAEEQPVYGWLQYIDGVKTQNFARDEKELADIKMIFRQMGHTGKVEYVPLCLAAPTPPAPQGVEQARDAARRAEYGRIAASCSMSSRLINSALAHSEKKAADAAMSAQPDDSGSQGNG